MASFLYMGDFGDKKYRKILLAICKSPYYNSCCTFVSWGQCVLFYAQKQNKGERRIDHEG